LYIYAGFVELPVYSYLEYTGKEQDRPTFLDPNISPTSLYAIWGIYPITKRA
jgi:hypothetical protein